MWDTRAFENVSWIRQDRRKTQFRCRMFQRGFCGVRSGIEPWPETDASDLQDCSLHSNVFAFQWPSCRVLFIVLVTVVAAAPVISFVHCFVIFFVLNCCVQSLPARNTDGHAEVYLAWQPAFRLGTQSDVALALLRQQIASEERDAVRTRRRALRPRFEHNGIVQYEVDFPVLRPGVGLRDVAGLSYRAHGTIQRMRQLDICRAISPRATGRNRDLCFCSGK